jgi:long-chain acyl-CoA synthetase
MRRDTLLDFFDDFADLSSEFLIYDDGLRSRSYQYREVAGLARSFAARLRAAGIGKDEKIILYSENRPEWVIALWGCLLEGVIAVPIDFRSSPEFVARVREIVQARVILKGDEVELTGAEDVWPIAALTHQTDVTQPEHRPKAFATQTAEIIFTSGATADPKGVVITHRNILANIVPVEREVSKYRKYARPFAPIRFLNLLPLSHMFGQAMATFIPPMLPGVVVFMRGYNPSEIIRQIRTRRISVLVSVPKILEVLREYLLHYFPELASEPETKSHWMLRWWRYRKIHNLFGWKFWSFIVGAAPLAPELEAFWSRLGFVVIQGYGLTEAAPIVTLNHPFHARQGSVGKPIAGVEVKIAEDGEILVRGDNVTSGYYNEPGATAQAFENGWFHTGDVGQLDENGELRILGRKKEMIVTPEGLNVFPEDVERVLNQIPGVRDSAVIGSDRVHAVLILDPGAEPDAIVRSANARLADHQKIRSASTWPYPEFPRTEGTGKLKRREIAQGVPPREQRSRIDLDTPLENLTSLERVEREVALGVSGTGLLPVLSGSAESIQFPAWNRSWWARAIRRIFLPLFLLPLTRVFARIRVAGLENLKNVQPPVIFAPNHQSYMDVTAIMAALPPRWRYRIAPAMSKEFFHEHFHGRSFTNSLNYYLSALFFNAFPIPQREAGALETMRYMGELATEGWCILIFPEGKMTNTGEIASFQPGVGMLASKLDLPVVPVRLEGLDRVLHHTWKMARPGKVRIKFGKPLELKGNDYPALAKRVEDAVRCADKP